jgi:6,7-dimethyl-8-ribityllumazine synthase
VCGLGLGLGPVVIVPGFKKMTDIFKNTRIAFIKARWHSDIVDRAYEGFTVAAKQILPGATIEVFDVPGAFEMPLLAKKLGQTGKYHAVVAAAFVVDGGIYRHDFVAAAVVDGLMAAQMATGVPTFSVSLTPHNFQPVPVMNAFFQEHFVKKGEEAANAVRQILELDQRLPKGAVTKAA